MHQLTIDAAQTDVSCHPDHATARRALLAYAVRSDYYLREIQTTASHTSYELLELADLEAVPGDAYRQCPRVAGTAVIETVPAHQAATIKWGVTTR